jgi:hypothetical protein
MRGFVLSMLRKSLLVCFGTGVAGGPAQRSMKHRWVRVQECSQTHFIFQHIFQHIHRQRHTNTNTLLHTSTHTHTNSHIHTHTPALLRGLPICLLTHTHTHTHTHTCVSVRPAYLFHHQTGPLSHPCTL